MSIFVNVLCALIGVIGTYAVMKIQMRDQRKDGMKRDLLDCVAEIDRRMITDIAEGALSAELQVLLRETDARIAAYCRGRWYRPGANRRLRAVWRDFYDTLTGQKLKKPVRLYEYVEIPAPADYGLDAKIGALYRALN